MKVLVLLVIALQCGCANLPPRTYSLALIDERGRSAAASLSLGAAPLPRPAFRAPVATLRDK